MLEVFTNYVEFYFVVYKPAFGITCNFLFVSAFVHFGYCSLIVTRNRIQLGQIKRKKKDETKFINKYLF